MTNDTSVQYAGFWRRFAATLIDSLLIVLVMLPILLAIYGAEYFEGVAEIKSGWVLALFGSCLIQKSGVGTTSFAEPW